jgi:hypothetical protein
MRTNLSEELRLQRHRSLSELGPQVRQFAERRVMCRARFAKRIALSVIAMAQQSDRARDLYLTAKNINSQGGENE